MSTNNSLIVSESRPITKRVNYYRSLHFLELVGLFYSKLNSVDMTSEKEKERNFISRIYYQYVLFFLSLTILSGMSCSSTKLNKAQSKNQTIEEMVSKINTEVDSEFIYDYEKTKFVPKEGKTLLIQGQSLNNINDYRASSKYKNYPGGWSAYWAVTEFSGITESWATPSGDTQNHQFLVDKFDNMVLHSAMWMVGKWGVAQRAKNGAYDHVIRQYSDWAKTVNRPIYLRIGYEFDGPHNELEPSEYIEAYKHIVDLMRSEGVKNIAFVWHSYASVPYKNYALSEWYPGDDYVDWVGISVFGHSYSEGLNTEGDIVLEFAKNHKKPVMIAESSPIFGIEKNNAKVWDDWFVNFFLLIYNKNIKAVCFINQDWTRLNIEGLSEWKDARLYNNEQVLKAWFMETNKDKYLKQSPNLFSELGYSKE